MCRPWRPPPPSLLREDLPDLRIRVVNVVDLMALQPQSEHLTVSPTKSSTRCSRSTSRSSSPITAIQDVHRLTYRRRNHGNFHVRGYQEEGTTTTPFDDRAQSHGSVSAGARCHSQGSPARASRRSRIEAIHRRAAAAQAIRVGARRGPARGQELDLGTALSQDAMRVLVINCGSTTLKYKLLGEADDGLKLLAGASQDIAVGYRNAVEKSIGMLPVAPDVSHIAWCRWRDDCPKWSYRSGSAESAPPSHASRANAQRTGARRHRGDALDWATPRRCARHSLSRQPSAERLALRTAGLDGVRRYGFHGGLTGTSPSAMPTHETPEPTSSRFTWAGGAQPPRFSAGARWTLDGILPTRGTRDGHTRRRSRPGHPDSSAARRHDVAELERLLYHEAGLKALAGTADMRELLQRSDTAAALALDICCARIRKTSAATSPCSRGPRLCVYRRHRGECPGNPGACLLWVRLGRARARARAEPSERASHFDRQIGACSYAIPTDEETLIAREIPGRSCAAGQGPP